MNACCCPTCGQPLPQRQEDRVAELAQSYRAWCEERGHWVSADGRVREDVAAQLVDRSPLTIRNWFYDGRLPGVQIMPRGRRTYRLTDLAAAHVASGEGA